MAPSTLNPVTFTILSRRIDAAASAMQHTLVRSSRSGVIANGHDCSCCVLSANDELLSVAETIPIHVMSGADQMARSMKEFHTTLERGDAYLHNSPYHGCTHAADLSVLVPVMDAKGQHRFTVIAKSHQADIGNSLPTTYMAEAVDLYEEGALIFPAVTLQKNFITNEDVVRMGRMRIRSPDQWLGDLKALLGAARTGEAALERLAEEFGWDTLDTFTQSWLDFSEAEMSQSIRSLPAGRASGESVHDPFPGTPADGVRVNVTVQVEPHDGRIVVDLRDNIDCMPNGLNMSEATARSAALIGVFNCVGAHVPVNAGSARRVSVELRDRCAIGGPTATTSCSVATTNLADRVVNAVHRAMSTIAPEHGMAEAGAIEGPAGAVLSGTDARKGGKTFVNQLALAGTAGAGTPGADGWLSLGNACSAGMWTLDSIEADELVFPFHVWQRRLVVDSEGAGEYRGAPSCEVAYEPCGEPMQVHYAADGSANPARGVHGGTDGGAVQQWLQRSNGELVDLPSVGAVTVQPGERVIARTSAGGGFGEPRHRAVDAVVEDVREGYISIERAEQVYSVSVDASGTLDEQRTAAMRHTPSVPAK